MDAKTLVNAWQPITHASPLVADSWQLGEYLICRLAGSAAYDLFGAQGFQSLAIGSLVELKAEGARRWAADIAQIHARSQIEPLDDGDVDVQDHGSIALFRPLSKAAQEWIESNVADDAQWLGGSLAVEPRFASYLIEGMVAAGLTFS